MESESTKTSKRPAVRTFLVPKVTRDKYEAELKDHPVAKALDSLIHGLRDSEVAVTVHVPYANIRLERSLNTIEKKLAESKLGLDSTDRNIRIKAVQDIMGIDRRLDRISRSRVPTVLEASLFIGAFSAFDVFTGQLIKAVFSKKPELFNSINRSISLGELLQYESVDALKDEFLVS